MQRSLSPIFKEALANTSPLGWTITSLQSTSFCFPREVATRIPHFFVVNMHTAPSKITEKIIKCLTRTFAGFKKNDMLKTREWNGGVFAICFGEVVQEEGSEQVLNVAACATVIMPPTREGNDLLDFVTTKHPESGCLVQPPIPESGQQPVIMDFRKYHCVMFATEPVIPLHATSCDPLPV